MGYIHEWLTPEARRTQSRSLRGVGGHSVEALSPGRVIKRLRPRSAAQHPKVCTLGVDAQVVVEPHHVEAAIGTQPQQEGPGLNVGTGITEGCCSDRNPLPGLQHRHGIEIRTFVPIPVRKQAH